MSVSLKKITIVLSFIPGLQAMEEDRGNCYPNEIWHEILMSVPKSSEYQKKILELKSQVSFEAFFGNLRLVCKDWEIILNNIKKIFWKKALVSAYETIGYGDICETFLNGRIQYTPDKENPITLLIADLKQPFSGAFNLSTCKDAGMFISIRTGYRKKKIEENDEKMEIWLTPWFIVNGESSTTSHLAPILSQWNGADAPIGIFWTWGKWTYLTFYEYLISHGINSLSDNLLNLYHENKAFTPEFRIVDVCSINRALYEHGPKFKFVFNQP